MTKGAISRAKAWTEKEQRKNIINRKAAVVRRDVKTELAISEKIEIGNTILWALEAAKVAASDGVFGRHIMERFMKVE